MSFLIKKNYKTLSSVKIQLPTHGKEINVGTGNEKIFMYNVSWKYAFKENKNKTDM